MNLALPNLRLDADAEKSIPAANEIRDANSANRAGHRGRGRCLGFAAGDERISIIPPRWASRKTDSLFLHPPVSRPCGSGEERVREMCESSVARQFRSADFFCYRRGSLSAARLVHWAIAP